MSLTTSDLDSADVLQENLAPFMELHMHLTENLEKLKEENWWVLESGCCLILARRASRSVTMS